MCSKSFTALPPGLESLLRLLLICSVVILSWSISDSQHDGYVQLAPVAYVKDTKALLECIPDYDDTYERGGPGSKLVQGFEDTARLWESTFGLSYERAGSMYRNTRPVNVPPPPVSDPCMKSALYEKPPTILPWDFREADQNPTKYPVLTPRHVLQVMIPISSWLVLNYSSPMVSPSFLLIPADINGLGIDD